MSERAQQSGIHHQMFIAVPVTRVECLFCLNAAGIFSCITELFCCRPSGGMPLCNCFMSSLRASDGLDDEIIDVIKITTKN